MDFKFICPEHGLVNPSNIGYSCPAMGWCPVCNRQIPNRSSDESYIKILSGEEAYRLRPKIYHDGVRKIARILFEERPDLDCEEFFEFVSLRVVARCKGGDFDDLCKEMIGGLVEEWSQTCP